VDPEQQSGARVTQQHCNAGRPAGADDRTEIVHVSCTQDLDACDAFNQTVVDDLAGGARLRGHIDAARTATDRAQISDRGGPGYHDPTCAAADRAGIGERSRPGYRDPDAPHIPTAGATDRAGIRDRGRPGYHDPGAPSILTAGATDRAGIGERSRPGYHDPGTPGILTAGAAPDHS
jgi:hypothetical protein